MYRFPPTTEDVAVTVGAASALTFAGKLEAVLFVVFITNWLPAPSCTGEAIVSVPPWFMITLPERSLRLVPALSVTLPVGTLAVRPETALAIRSVPGPEIGPSIRSVFTWSDPIVSVLPAGTARPFGFVSAVVTPAAELLPNWYDPITALSVTLIRLGNSAVPVLLESTRFATATLLLGAAFRLI